MLKRELVGGLLAFEETGVDMIFDERLGIMLGSLTSGILGFSILYVCLPRKQNQPQSAFSQVSS